MIYRIYHNDQYLTFEIPTREVLDKLGRAYPFHINRTPISYAEVWKIPLHVKFRPPEDFTQNIVPDIAEVDGKLFLNEKAYNILKSALSSSGEALPVTYDGGTGYIFNILVIAEDKNGIDESRVGYDKNDNLSQFGFNEGIMETIPLFRIKLDHYLGIFCNEVIKTLIEESGLIGVIFGSDVANPLAS